MNRVLLLLACTLQLTVFGQNVPRYSQFNFAQGINNPAALALDGEMMADLIFRNQWFGIKGAPSTGGLNLQYELYHDMAIGLTATYDVIGVHHATQISGQYAYRLFTSQENAWIFGVSAGMDQRVHDLGSAQVLDSDDPAFASLMSKLHFNAGLGVYYHSPKFYFGFSVPQLFQNTIRGPWRGFVPPRWHMYSNVGFYWDINENYTLNPCIQAKAVMNAPIQGDLLLRNTFMGRFSLIVGYRSENSIIAGFDMLFSGYVRAGYAFNYDVGRLARIKGISNELYLGIALPYHHSREDFFKKKYLNRKRGYKRDFHKGYKQRRWYK